MVVRRAFGPPSRRRHAHWPLCAIAVLVGLGGGWPSGWAASSPIGGVPSSPAFHAGTGQRSTEAQAFDPTAAQFNSLLSYGAMSLIAPTIFGDFQSATAVSYPSFSWRGAVMPENTGVDTAALTTVSNVVQPDLLPRVAALMANAFGVDAASGGATNDAATGSANGSDPSVDDVTAIGVAANSERGGSGLNSSCGNEVPNQLQAGGQFWNSQSAGRGPVQFPPGVFAGSDTGNPFGDLGPSGDRTNLPNPGPGGDWCRPRHLPFSQSSPLESAVFWIMVYVVLAAVLVAWLSRGHRLPAI